MFVLVFTNRGYKGEYIDGGLTEVQELIDGRTNEEGKKEQIVEMRYKNGTIYFLLDGSKYKDAFPEYADYYLYYEGNDGILTKVLEKLDTAGINYQKIANSKDWWSIVYPLLYIAFGLFMVWMIFRLMGSQSKGAMGFGKSKARAYTTSKVRFADIAGTEEEKEELKEIVEFLKAPKKFTDLGARIPKGVLLVGHPGTGKTLLARAVAGEANVPFITISGSDFVEMFVGVGASRVRDLFEQAKKNKPCIVFIDEIDAVGRQRGAGLGGGNDEREQTLNQLLVEMDGFEPNEGIIVLAATNRSDVLDPALMRPGRFDRQIYVNIPDVKGREGILKIHAKNKPIDENVDFKTLAKITVGFTGADIENMLNEAAILAAREGRPKIVMSDITEGINKVTMGPKKKSRVVTERDKKITAYHEAGHAILAKKLENTDEVQEVSIIPRGMAGGYTMQRPDNDNSYRTYNYLMDEIAVCMGGRLAEEIVFKDITTGASSDINQATKIARNMVYNWGMSKNLGFLSLDSSEQVFIGRDYQTRNDFSEKLAAEADDEVRQILDYNYKRAKKILADNLDLLHEMSNLLLEEETINKEEIDMLLEGKKTAEIVEAIKERNEKQKEKEEKLKQQKALLERKLLLENKIREGEKLVEGGVLTAEELEKIKETYNQLVAQIENESQEKAEEQEVTVTIKQGIELPKAEDNTPEDKEGK
ncbi:MAG: ATP-dependent zinc metalloprotease FtsH [Clostridia bacterium]|nr:ATP-dependent zinc metalloprotease FtsH [Clostridia bacterium]